MRIYQSNNWINWKYLSYHIYRPICVFIDIMEISEFHQKCESDIMGNQRIGSSKVHVRLPSLQVCNCKLLKMCRRAKSSP